MNKYNIEQILAFAYVKMVFNSLVLPFSIFTGNCLKKYGAAWRKSIISSKKENILIINRV